MNSENQTQASNGNGNGAAVGLPPLPTETETVPVPAKAPAKAPRKAAKPRKANGKGKAPAKAKAKRKAAQPATAPQAYKAAKTASAETKKRVAAANRARNKRFKETGKVGGGAASPLLYATDTLAKVDRAALRELFGAKFAACFRVGKTWAEIRAAQTNAGFKYGRRPRTLKAILAGAVEFERAK